LPARRGEGSALTRGGVHILRRFLIETAVGIRSSGGGKLVALVRWATADSTARGKATAHPTSWHGPVDHHDARQPGEPRSGVTKMFYS